jgi:predicted  nucleic acid-binding Zn-ribbon protein
LEEEMEKIVAELEEKNQKIIFLQHEVEKLNQENKEKSQIIGKLEKACQDLENEIMKAKVSKNKIKIYN